MYSVVLALAVLMSAASISGHHTPAAIFADPEAYSYTMVDTPLYHYHVYAPSLRSPLGSPPFFCNNPSPMPPPLDDLFYPSNLRVPEGSVDLHFQHLGFHNLENNYFYPNDVEPQTIPPPSIHRQTQTISPYVPKTDFDQNLYAPSFKPHLPHTMSDSVIPNLASTLDSPPSFPNIIREEGEGGTFPLSIFQGNTYSPSSQPNLASPSYNNRVPPNKPIVYPTVLSSYFPNIIRGEAQLSSPQPSFYPLSSTSSSYAVGFPMRNLPPTLSTPVFEETSKTLFSINTAGPEEYDGLTTISPLFHYSESTTPITNEDHPLPPSNLFFQAPGHEQPSRR